MDHGILIAGFLSLSTLLSFMKGVVGLGIVIFVHELGHFLVAKACGVKCEKFYVGFDPPLKFFGIPLPRTLFKRQWGETEYGIGIVPLGGYVKMLGQDDNPSNAEAEAERIRTQDGQLDPRSYPAKSVPQRMAIISAGVVFNLIFGVVFASVAYRMGVIYTPTVVGHASVGDPAWMAGIQPGDRIVALKPDAPVNDHLRFMNDLRIHLLSLDEEQAIDMRLRGTDGEVREINIMPNSGYKKLTKTRTIGVRMAPSSTVAAVTVDSMAQLAGLKPGDKILAVTVAGQRTEIAADRPALELQQILQSSAHLPLTLHVSRNDAETKSVTQHDLEIPIARGKRYGIVFDMGPVVCIQRDSIADRAGMQVGDVIVSIDGQPIGDPLTLSGRMLDYVGKSVEMVVRRGTSEIPLEVTPRIPRMEDAPQRRDAPLGLDTLGIGYVMQPTVAGVVPGSPAAEAGIQPGDIVQTAQLLVPFVPTPKEKRWPWLLGDWQDHRKKNQLKQVLQAYELDRPLVIDADNNNWPYVANLDQMLGGLAEDEPLQVRLSYQRNGQDLSVDLVSAPLEALLDPMRGFALRGHDEIRTAQDWSEALSLGTREVWEGMKQVLVVLRKIGSNYQNVGGPLTIAAVATMEADEGLPRLLVFLTLLSANLAVLNFLPIPVLDGGHIVFLAYEGIVGKPVNERIQMSLTLLGFSFLMCLMLFVLGLDLTRFLG